MREVRGNTFWGEGNPIQISKRELDCRAVHGKVKLRKFSAKVTLELHE